MDYCILLFLDNEPLICQQVRMTTYQHLHSGYSIPQGDVMRAYRRSLNELRFYGL